MRGPLDLAALSRAVVSQRGAWRELRYVAETGSTSADVAAAAREGAPEGLVVLADHQADGRGRLGRAWVSPPGAGLAFSALLRPAEVDPRRWSWLPLLVGVGVVEAVRHCAGVRADLKWPNDVMVNGRKLGGILLERVETPDGPAAVVGVGLNVSSTADELPDNGTSLVLENAATVNRLALVKAVLRFVEGQYLVWVMEDGDPDSFLWSAYRQRCTTLGQQVRVHLPDGKHIEGLAVDVDGHGRLVVSRDGVKVAVAAGDVVHVR